MAYQNVGTPRFYIDLPSYITSMGGQIETNSDKRLFNLDPSFTKTANFSTPYDVEVEGSTANFPSGMNGLEVEFHDKISNLLNVDNLYIALLNFNRENFQYKVHGSDFDHILNVHYAGSGGNAGERVEAFYKGCHITIFKSDSFFLDMLHNKFRLNDLRDVDSEDEIPTLDLGCISFGSYYDMPHSPDLDLSMEIEFDGYDSVQTLGGSTLTNVKYNGSPWWYDVDGNKVEPWAVGESTGVSKRNGRRIWSLKFSYMNDKDIFASNYMSNTYIQSSNGYDSADLDFDDDSNRVFYYNLNNDDSFVSQVLNKIGNGQRFIFQPDNTNNNPDQFAICVLEQDSLEIKQVANSVYDFSLKIKEVW